MKLKETCSIMQFKKLHFMTTLNWWKQFEIENFVCTRFFKNNGMKWVEISYDDIIYDPWVRWEILFF